MSACASGQITLMRSRFSHSHPGFDGNHILDESKQLCRRTVRKGSAFPADVSFTFEAMPQMGDVASTRLGDSHGKAKPYRTVCRQSRSVNPGILRCGAESSCAGERGYRRHDIIRFVLVDMRAYRHAQHFIRHLLGDRKLSCSQTEISISLLQVGRNRVMN